MEKLRAVLFDWDGTLYDSVRLCYEIYNELFQRFGVGAITYKEFRRDFSGDYHRYQQMHGLGEDVWGEFDSAWYELYYERKGSTGPFQNAEQTLSRLQGLNVPVGLVTNATRNRLGAEIAELGFGKYFKTVVTIEDAEWDFKPSPRMINEACKSIGLGKKETLYVGDMVEDVKAGRASGVVTGVVPTGVHTISKLSAEGPDFMFNDIGEVPVVFR